MMKKIIVVFLAVLVITAFSTKAEAGPSATGLAETLSGIGDKVMLGGYTHGYYIANQESKERDFNFHCVALDITAGIWENAMFSAELFSHPDSGTKPEPFFLYAYLDYSFNDLATLRFGRFLTPWGKFNEMHDPPHRDLSTHPLIQQYLSPIHWNEQGVQLHGEGSLAGDALFAYSLYVSNGINETRVNTPQNAFPPSGDNNDKPALGGKFRFLPFKEVDMGVAAYTGKWDDAGKNDLTRFNVDFSYDYLNTYGPISLKFEYMWSEVEGNTKADNSSGDYSQNGFFVQAAYKFLEQKDSYWKGVLRYDEMDRNSTINDRWDRERLTVGLVYSPIPPLQFQTEYAWTETEEVNYDPNSFEAAVVWHF